MLVLIFLSCKKEGKITLKPIEVYSDDFHSIPAYNFDNFQKLLSIDDGKIRVINFWATWCKPCVAELPFFEMINKKYKDRGVEVILVSLDMPNLVEKKLLPFLKKQKEPIQSDVILLDDPDANSWIPKVDSNWSGAIPATIIYKGDNVQFYEQSFTYNSLETELKKMFD